MGEFYCPECGWSGDKKVCSNCGEICEELTVGDDGAPRSTSDEDKYPEDLLKIENNVLDEENM